MITNTILGVPYYNYSIMGNPIQIIEAPPLASPAYPEERI